MYQQIEKKMFCHNLFNFMFLVYMALHGHIFNYHDTCISLKLRKKSFYVNIILTI